jgi:hypothetical protein
MGLLAETVRRIDEQECIERVMTMHWRANGCACQVCDYGRGHGWGPDPMYMDPVEDERAARLEQWDQALVDILRRKA